MASMTFYPAVTEHKALPMNDIVPLDDIELSESAKKYARLSRKEATLKSYTSDWKHFESWCNERSYTPLPTTVNVVATYAAWMADEGFAANTIGKRVIVVGLAHQAVKHWNPCGDPAVKKVLSGIKNSLGGPVKKQALLNVHLRQMIETLDRGTVEGRRDFALVVLGFAGAFRRSELVSIQLNEINTQNDGLVITVPENRSKGGSAQKKPIVATHTEYCPVRAVMAVQADLRESGDATGLLFPSARKKKQPICDRYFSELLKKLAISIGLDGRNIAGHSTRRGRITQMSLDNHGLLDIKRISNHKSLQVLTGYIEQTDSLTNAAKADL